MQQVMWLIQHKVNTEFQKDIAVSRRVKMLDLVNQTVLAINYKTKVKLIKPRHRAVSSNELNIFRPNDR